MGPTPPIDVLLPCFNSAETLNRAVQSIVDQSYPNWRLLLLDDGSTDESGAQIRFWSSQDSRIEVHCWPHRGLVETLNAGLERCRAPFIARMDADDWSSPERFALQIQALQKNPEWDVVASRVAHGGDPAPGLEAYIDWTNGLLTPGDLSSARFIEAPIIHPSVMFHSHCLARGGHYRRGDFPEDYELWLRWFQAGLVFGKTEVVLLHWFDHGKRLTRTDPRYDRQAFYRVKSKYLHQWLQPITRPIWVWGAGRRTRQRVAYLQQWGTVIQAWVDIDPKKIGKIYHAIPVVGPDTIPDKESVFVLGYVGNRGARREIEQFLIERGFVAGRDFIFAA